MNSTVNDVQNTDEFRRLTKLTEDDLNALNNELEPIAAKIFDESLPFEKRLQILGEAICCTLLAFDHRGGYPIDYNGIQLFRQDLLNDFGINLDACAKALGFSTVKNFLMSTSMERYIALDINRDRKQVFRGRPFENDLLKELMAEQKEGFEFAEQKANQKNLERQVRLNAAKMNETAIEGRLRIYQVIKKLSGNNSERVKWILYQDLQREYEKFYGVALNKAEIKKFFGISDTFKAFKEYTSDDLIVMMDNDRAGYFYVKLKRSYEEIESAYKQMLEEVKSLPSLDAVSATNGEDAKSKNVRNSREPITYRNRQNERTRRHNMLITELNLYDRQLPSSSNDDVDLPKPSIVPKVPMINLVKKASVKKTFGQVELGKNTNYTARGEGKFSDDDSDNDDLA